VKGEIVVFETNDEWKRVSKLTNEQCLTPTACDRTDELFAVCEIR